MNINIRRWAYAATILAGTHMAQLVMSVSDDYQWPPVIPIQWYGPGYGGPPPYDYGPPQIWAVHPWREHLRQDLRHIRVMVTPIIRKHRGGDEYATRRDLRQRLS